MLLFVEIVIGERLTKLGIFKRIFLIVLDSVGIGEAPDAVSYGDVGADTVGNIAKRVGRLNLPTLASLGFGHLKSVDGIEQVENPLGYFGKMIEASVGKDTMTGHWELAGLHVSQPFKTFPKGFPEELLNELSRRTGRDIIGNVAASGTVIIEELGEQHMKSGAMIVYTSADSVLQIAAHESVIPLEELYSICEIARELTMDERFLVGRVIARPFIGEQGAFQRTANRHDYALKPFGRTVMNALSEAGLDVIALGKINDIFDGSGVTEAIRTKDNEDGMDKITEMVNKSFSGLCFINLVDFDANYGHRRDPAGYAKALECFDHRLTKFLPELKEDDLLIMTADHGNDPTFTGTDHTREMVPLIVYHRQVKVGGPIATRQTFADVGATIAENFSVQLDTAGTSFLLEISE